MLTPQQIALLQQELRTAKNPLFIHDDDPDGLCSFLLLYRIHRVGKESLLKSTPKLDANFIRKVTEYNPDKIFVLDVPIVEQEFIDQANRPIFWIDHHQPLERTKVHYFNPRIADPQAYVPTTYMAWQVSRKPEDLWIATAGCLADHYMPDFIDDFITQYPQLLSKKVDIGTATFKQPVGELVKIFFFLLKGPTSEVRNSLKILTRIQTVEEILNQTSSQGKFLYKRFEKINKKYLTLIKEAKKKVGKEQLTLFAYTDDHWSFTAELSNELSACHPDKVVLICRKKSGEMKCSLRASFAIADILQKALVGINGFGGGHPQACGAVIKEKDWDFFLENLKRELTHD